MPDLTALRDLTSMVRPRDLEELRAVVRRRRRTTALATVASAGAALALVVAGASIGPRTASPAPVAPEPTATSSPSRDPRPTQTVPREDTVRGPFPTLTPEEVRSHPQAVMERSNDFPVTAAPGVAARMWTVCLADCSRDTTYQEGEVQRALEVTRDDFRSSALLPNVPPEPNISHVVGDLFALSSVEDAALVDARGEARSLTVGAGVPVSGIAGPLVYASSGLAYVDVEAAELHEVEGSGYWDWWGAGDTWYWGNVFMTNEAGDVVRQGLTWRNPDGSHGVRMLPIGVTDWSTQMLESGVPGTMGAIEPGPARLLHVSTDYGATWEVRVLPERWGTDTYVPDDWRSWTEDWPSWATP
jgi:hypothetical protein